MLIHVMLINSSNPKRVSFDYSKISVYSVPDYVISISENNYEIYEVDD